MMILQITLPPGMEARLRERSAAAGMEPADIVLEAVEQSLAYSDESRVDHVGLTQEQRVSEWLAWTASHRPLGYVVDDSRETIYAGRGE